METKPSNIPTTSMLNPEFEIELPKKAPACLGPDGRKAYANLREDHGHLLCLGDVPSIIAYCSAVDQLVMSAKKLKVLGAVIEVEGKLVANPWSRIWKEASGSIASLSVKLGIARSTKRSARSKGDDARREIKRIQKSDNVVDHGEIIQPRVA